ncbi:hypothetical protein Aglo03_46050 [Actinokineospora globicatena]|uniref:Uncharacterized protein n=1 Tax=Actinokineospora globicatena TaxID=103729 RepID=A0A9W6QSH9_9PSEU|nr:hypothetical protein Aglo03_46050 [Actinokineospora globicatena]
MSLLIPKPTNANTADTPSNATTFHEIPNRGNTGAATPTTPKVTTGAVPTSTHPRSPEAYPTTSPGPPATATVVKSNNAISPVGINSELHRWCPRKALVPPSINSQAAPRLHRPTPITPGNTNPTHRNPTPIRPNPTHRATRALRAAPRTNRPRAKLPTQA